MEKTATPYGENGYTLWRKRLHPMEKTATPYGVTLSEIGTHFVTYIYYYCAHLSLSLPEAVHNLLSRFLCVYTVSLRVQR